MLNLLDPKLDYIFKNIFGSEKNKRLLISLLNAILDGKPLIKDLTFENTDIAKILEEDKSSRLDIKATADDETKIDVEIQCRNTGEIPERAMHYLANMFPRAIKAGDSYDKIKVLSIWILGENVTGRQRPISDAYMTFQNNPPDPFQTLTESARIIFVELANFNPKTESQKDLLTAWLSFLKNPAFMESDFLKVQEVKEAMDMLKYISADDEVRAIADLREKTISDKNSELTVTREKSLAEGRAEGLIKGRAEGLAEGEKIGEARGIRKGARKQSIETAKNFLKMGLSITQVSQGTGLSIEEVKALQYCSHLKDNVKEDGEN